MTGPRPHAPRTAVAVLLTALVAAAAAVAVLAGPDTVMHRPAAPVTAGRPAPVLLDDGPVPLTEAMSAQARQACAAFARSGLVPASPGAWLGTAIDWTAGDTPQKYRARGSVAPAVYNRFAAIPANAVDRRALELQVRSVQSAGAALLLTLQPTHGLAAVTPDVLAALTGQLRRYQQGGVLVYVNYAPEMNGDWFAWGMTPQAFLNSYRAVADAVHASGPYAKTVWSPNYGGGYPFTDDKVAPVPAPGSASLAALDTNHDGSLDEGDDPYAPYWPGKGFVDWVGMSLYHWSNQWPITRNDIAEPGVLAADLTGSYDGSIGDERYVPDFYDLYARRQGLPLMLTETGAMFVKAWHVGPAAPSEEAVKRAWYAQVYSPALARRFPLLRLVSWFEVSKDETAGVDQHIEWGNVATPALAAAFRSALPRDVRTAEDLPSCHP